MRAKLELTHALDVMDNFVTGFSTQAQLEPIRVALRALLVAEQERLYTEEPQDSEPRDSQKKASGGGR